jgi:DNA modification methylase
MVNEYYKDNSIVVFNKSCTNMSELSNESVQMVCTSPPYWGLRRYDGNQDIPGWGCSYGLEKTPELYVAHSIEILREIKRVLRNDGVCFINLGDSYSGSGMGGNPDNSKFQKQATNKGSLIKGHKPPPGLKPKDLCLIPFRVAIAAQEDGWWVRSVIHWVKNNPMPESVHGSHYIRHYVTIEEYERLQSLRTTESNNQDGTSDLPGLQEGEISNSQEALSAEREGSSSSEGEGTTSRCERETPSGQPFNSGQEESEVRVNGQGQNNSGESDCEIQFQAGVEVKVSRKAYENEEQSRTDRSKEESQSALQQDNEGQVQEATGLCEQEGGNSSRPDSNGGGLARDIESPQESMPLLPQEESSDNGPRDTGQQGREARQGEHSTSLPELQLQEEGQPNLANVECPGCPKCNPHNGYIHIKGSGRPTDAVEYILMLTKSDDYFYDTEAVREAYTKPLNRYGGDSKKLSDNLKEDSPYSTAHRERDMRPNPSGRNRLNWWLMNTQSYPGAHFATFPEKLPERCIKAATPEYGCCDKCGKPYKRIMDIKQYPRHETEYADLSTDGNGANRGKHAKPTETQTLGWQQSCKCENSKPVPSTVLDPFAGSGTTLAVAKRNGRRGIGYELSISYCNLIKKRVEAETAPFFGILA